MLKGKPLLPESIKEAKHLRGKVLKHVRMTADGLGFAFCFEGEEESSGPLALCYIHTEGSEAQLRLSLNTLWQDQTEVLYDSNG